MFQFRKFDGNPERENIAQWLQQLQAGEAVFFWESIMDGGGVEVYRINKDLILYDTVQYPAEFVGIYSMDSDSISKLLDAAENFTS